MAYDPEKHHRRSIRLPGYNYGASGGYFVTICAAHRRYVFGKIENDVMRLHPYGKIVEKCWNALPDRFPNVALDAHITMPNHFHGILIVGAGSSRPDSNGRGRGRENPAPTFGHHAGHGREDPAPTLGQMVAYLKYQSTKRINIHRAARGVGQVVVWQRNYFERIIRDENELNETRRYVIENPINWNTDENYRE